jgi:putative ABC transport system permease protein
MFFRLLLESLRRSRRRKVLAGGAICLGLAGLTAIGSVFLVAGDGLAHAAAAYGANLEIAPRAGETLPDADLAALRSIFWRNNLVALAPLLEVQVRWEAGSTDSPHVRYLVAPLAGTWFDHALPDGWRSGLPRTRPTLAVAGRWPREDAAEVALGRRLALTLGANIGATVAAGVGSERRNFQVVGIVGGGGAEEDRGFAPLAAVQGLVGRPGAYTRAELFALTIPETDASQVDPRRLSPADYEAWYCTAFPSAVAHQVGEALPGARVSVVRGVAGASGVLLGRVREILLVMAGLLALGAALGTTAAMAATVLERRVEVGLLAALGAERLRIARFFLAEAAVIGLLGGGVGGVAGLVLGKLLAQVLFEQPAPWQPALVPLALLLGLVVAVVGSLPPVLRAVAHDPARVLKRVAA